MLKITKNPIEVSYEDGKIILLQGVVLRRKVSGDLMTVIIGRMIERSSTKTEDLMKIYSVSEGAYWEFFQMIPELITKELKALLENYKGRELKEKLVQNGFEITVEVDSKNYIF